MKGVEVLLDYMLKVNRVKSAKSLLKHMPEAKEFEISAKPAEQIRLTNDQTARSRREEQSPQVRTANPVDV
jgi:hypothetical protein